MSDRETKKQDPQWVHRQALQIAGLLPDDTDHALAVLDRARFLLQSWSFGVESEPERVQAIRPKLVE